MEKLKNLITDLFTNFTYDIIKKIFLILFAGGVSFPFSYMQLEKLNMPRWVIITLTIAIVSLIIFVVLLLYQYYSCKYVTFEKIESDYDIINKNMSFTYGKDRSICDTEITLLFNKKTREYYGKFYWSGSGKGDIKVLNKNFSLKILKQRTRYIEYVIIFDKAYKKGKKITFKLRSDMFDPNGTFSPYFATTVTVPTKNLKMKLKIDPSLYPISCLEREVIPPHGGVHHENSETVELDDIGEYEWCINKPKLSFQYSLNWSFKP